MTLFHPQPWQAFWEAQPPSHTSPHWGAPHVEARAVVALGAQSAHPSCCREGWGTLR